MKFIIVDTYYPAFLNKVYLETLHLDNQPYQHQWRVLMDQCFGTADFYSDNLQQLGHEATEIIANCRPLQMQWAIEHGLKPGYHLTWQRYQQLPIPRISKDWVYPILLAQVKSYRPDVIHFQDPAGTNPVFLRQIRPYVKLITAQIASPYPQQADFSNYDLMLSSFPHFVKQFKAQGLNSYYFNLGFEPKILPRLKPQKIYDTVFVGGLSREHKNRIQFFEQLAEKTALAWWGYGVENLADNSPLKKAYQGPAWALTMYENLFNARISLNQHIDVARNYANNMRLYESTGVGTMLLTDYKDNLHTLFGVDTEVAVYHNAQDCLGKIDYYLTHEKERQQLAEAGQHRTLNEHTYHHRMQEFVEIIKPYL